MRQLLGLHSPQYSPYRGFRKLLKCNLSATLGAAGLGAEVLAAAVAGVFFGFAIVNSLYEVVVQGRWNSGRVVANGLEASVSSPATLGRIAACLTGAGVSFCAKKAALFQRRHDSHLWCCPHDN